MAPGPSVRTVPTYTRGAVKLEVPDKALQEADTRVPGTPGAGAHLRDRAASPKPQERAPEAGEPKRERTPFRKGLFSGRDQSRGSDRDRQSSRGSGDDGSRRRDHPRGATPATATGGERDVQLTPRDPAKLKQEIVELKKVMEADANRMKKGKIPIWLTTRVKKRKAKLERLEAMLA